MYKNINEDSNNILLGDCLDLMQSIANHSIDLIYLDPPFFTGQKHSLKPRNRTQEFSFDDVWNSNLDYAKFLHQRILEMHRILKKTGSIFVHCDQHSHHLVRIILDDVFGIRQFRSEIVWSYKRWSNAKKGLLSAHQNIYFYSKTNHFKFHTIYNSYSEATNLDQILQRRRRDQHHKSIYDLDENGAFKHNGKKKGVPLSDVWEIPYLNPKAKERVGYPTQKPLLLLERIIRIASDENDIVLDPFCGSGTTCIASKLMNRKYIGIDQSLDAVELTKARLKNPIKTESNLLKRGRNSYQNADQKALSLLNGIPFNPVQRNQGIDAILTELFEGTPVLIRVQKPHETLAEAASFLIKAKKVKQAKKVILIQTQTNGLVSNQIEYEGLEILQAPSVQLAQCL